MKHYVAVSALVAVMLGVALAAPDANIANWGQCGGMGGNVRAVSCQLAAQQWHSAPRIVCSTIRRSRHASGMLPPTHAK